MHLVIPLGELSIEISCAQWGLLIVLWVVVLIDRLLVVLIFIVIIPKAVLVIVLVVVLVAVLIVDGIGSKLALLWVLWVMLLISTHVLVLITRIVIRRIGHLLIIFYGISSARLKQIEL